LQQKSLTFHVDIFIPSNGKAQWKVSELLQVQQALEKLPS